MHGISSNAIYFTPDIGEFPYVKNRLRKSRGTRDQIASIHWIMEKAREFQKKTSTSALLTMQSFGVDHSEQWKIPKDRSTRPPCLSPEKPVCRSRSSG